MGRYHSTKGKWLKFDGNQLHAVEAVKDNLTRYSLTLFVPKYLNHLTDRHWQDLQSHGKLLHGSFLAWIGRPVLSWSLRIKGGWFHRYW
eukprot:5698936-Amphidinium_carterae.2